jgi:hypothetical protein
MESSGLRDTGRTELDELCIRNLGASCTALLLRHLEPAALPRQPHPAQYWSMSPAVMKTGYKHSLMRPEDKHLVDEGKAVASFANAMPRKDNPNTYGTQWQRHLAATYIVCTYL